MSGGAGTAGGSTTGGAAASAAPSPRAAHYEAVAAAAVAAAAGQPGLQASPFASLPVQQQAALETAQHAQQQHHQQQRRPLHGIDAGVGGFGSVQLLPLPSGDAAGFGSRALAAHQSQTQQQQQQQQARSGASTPAYGTVQLPGGGYGGSLGFGIGALGGQSLQLGGAQDAAAQLAAQQQQQEQLGALLGTAGTLGSMQFSNLQLSSGSLSPHAAAAAVAMAAAEAEALASYGSRVESAAPRLQDMHSFTRVPGREASTAAAAAATAAAAAQAGRLSALQQFPHAALHAGSAGLQQLLGGAGLLAYPSQPYLQEQAGAYLTGAPPADAYAVLQQQLSKGQGWAPAAAAPAPAYGAATTTSPRGAYPSGGSSQQLASGGGASGGHLASAGGSMGGLTITTGGCPACALGVCASRQVALCATAQLLLGHRLQHVACIGIQSH